MADDKPKMTTEAPEVKQPDKTAPVVEGAKPEQAAAPTPAVEHPTPDNVVNIPFDKINEIMAEKNAGKREAVKEATAKAVKAAPSGDTRPDVEKPLAEAPEQGKQEKRRGRPPKADKTKQADTPKKEKAAAEEKPAKEAKAAKPTPKKETAPPEPPKEPEKPAEPVAAPRSGEVEQIVHIKLGELFAFKDHPFQVRDDDEMRAMVASVKDKGVSQPAIVRPREEGGYEIVSGHRRQKASELAGFTDMPCIVRNLTDEQAITQMVEDNTNQRENILPSERAKALKMQLEAIKHQGARETSGQVDPKEVGLRSNEIVALRNKMTVKQVQRYIKLNELVPDLMKLMDDKKLSFTPAVEIAFIKPKNQNYVAVAIEAQQAVPSLSQAQRMRELDQKGLLNGDVVDGIMCEEKKEVDKVIISGAELSNYFGKEKTPQEMKSQIIKLLDDWKGKEKEQAAPEKKGQKEK